MAKRPRKAQHAPNLSDHAGPDADAEAAATIAAAAAARAGSNAGEVSDEALGRNAQAIEACFVEINVALAVVQKARANLGVARKIAKKDGCPVDDLVDAVKLKMQAERGGLGPLVDERRNMARVLKLIAPQVAEQLNFLDALVVKPAPNGSAGASIDPYLQGYHAFKNDEPRENNAFTPGTDECEAWDRGWIKARDDVAEEASKPGGILADVAGG